MHAGEIYSAQNKIHGAKMSGHIFPYICYKEIKLTWLIVILILLSKDNVIQYDKSKTIVPDCYQIDFKLSNSLI